MSRRSRLAMPFSVVEAPPVEATAAAPEEDARLRPCAQCQRPQTADAYPLNRGFGAHARRSDVCIDCIRRAQKRSGRRAMPRQAICQDCGANFAGMPERVGGSHGRRCPNGHWTSDWRLAHPKTADAQAAPALADPAVIKTTVITATPMDVQRDVQRALRSHGFAGRIQQLELALAGLISSHDKLLEALPANSVVRGLVQGSFGHLPALGRALLAEGAR